MRMLRYTGRALLRAPGFTTAAVLSLALGIGANTAIFSLLDAIVLRPLPVRAPSELVALGAPRKNGFVGTAFSYPFYEQIASHPAFAGVLAETSWAATFQRDERVIAQVVTSNYFGVLGVRPALGRGLEETPAAAVLSHALWQTRFAGDPAAVGRQFLLDGGTFTVAGVAPPGFFGTAVGSAPDLWVTIAGFGRVSPVLAQQAARPQTRWLQIIARLRPGVARGQAEAAFGGADRLVLLPAAKGLSSLRTKYTRPLVFLMSGVALLLLIACANVANLMLARAAARRREMAVRLALGAGRGRLVGQALLESTLMSLAGGALALPLAFAAARFLVRLIPANFTVPITPDPRVLGFTFVVSLVCGLLFGLAPAFQGTDPALLTGERVAGRSRGFGLRGALVTAQVALSFLLLAGAGLFVRTLANLKDTDPGFATEGVVAAWLERSRPDAVLELTAKLREQPPVLAAAAGTYGALSGGERNEAVDLPGRPPEAEMFNVVINTVSTGYFDTLRIPLLAGRDFGPQDRAGTPRVVVISESAARYLFGREPALGRRIVLRWGAREQAEVVGVVKDTKYLSLREEGRRTVYLPGAQESGLRILYVRTRDVSAAAGAIRREAREQGVTVSRLRTLAAQIDDGLRQERLLALVSSFFGGLALLLAAVGIYGVVSYAVTRRTREIGIRMALGARHEGVLWMVVRQALSRAAVGLALGIPAALGLARLAGSLLYGLKPTDAATLAAAAAVLLASALAAACLPALRATRIDPARTLREQ